MRKSLFLPVAVALLFLIAGNAHGQKSPKIGIRGGIGTDISLGLAYGAGGNILFDLDKNYVEVGVVLFGGNFEESSDEGIHTYDETTDLIVFGLMANYLIGYNPRKPGLYFITGFGLASVNIEWEERSDSDSSLGTPLPGGGSMQSADGSGGGSVLNVGIGNGFSKAFDIRFEIPVIITFSGTGEASTVIPTFIATLGYRF